MNMTKHTKYTFKAYQTSSRDLLVEKLVDIKDWSHVGQVRASNELNHIEVDAFFSSCGILQDRRVKGATLLGAWKLIMID